MFYHFVINPIVLLYKWLYLSLFGLTGSYGISLLLMSVITFLVTSPFMRWAGRIQKNEKHIQDILKPQIDTIRSQSQGAEQHRRIANLYKSYAYHPAMAVRSVAGLAVQIPFLIAAYYMLSELPDIKGQSFLIINDLSKPDGLIGSINVLPILMTVINLMSACTTAAFARKDKLQAALIAFLFLLLLYTAPSALLIFWTCNNLWGLLGNLWKPFAANHGIAGIKLTVKGRTIPQWLSALSYETYVITALTATFFIFVPIDIYLRNSNEFWFSLGDIIWMLLFCFTATTLLLSALVYLLKGKAKTFFVYLLMGVVLGLFLQSYIINIDYGVLDGRQIDWSSYRKQGIINTLLWLGCIGLPFAVNKFIKRPVTFKKTFSRLSCGLILVQILTLVFLFSNTTIEEKNDFYLSTEKMFEVSSKNNIIIFILDTFDTEVFKEILDQEPAIANLFDGFTYYPDTVGSYPTTKGALPQILSNVWYENEEPFSKYIEKIWTDNKFFQFLKTQKYDIRLLSSSVFIGKTSTVDNLITAPARVSSYKRFGTIFYKLVLFRSVPHDLKKYFWIYTGDFDKYRSVKTNSFEQYKFNNDLWFYNKLITDKLSIENNKNSFRFYHLKGPHGPFDINRNIERVQRGSTTGIDQAIASLKIVSEYLEQLKSLGLYDKSVVLIMADHGHLGAFGRLPLMLIKPQLRKGNLITSSNPVSFSNLHASIVDGLENQKSRAADFGTPFSTPVTPLKPRRFVWYSWDGQWEKQYLPNMIEYMVIGHPKNINSWKKTGNIFAPGSEYDGCGYYLNDVIYFMSGGNSRKYTVNLNPFSGWSIPEKKYRWIFGKEALLNINTYNAKNKQLRLRLKTLPFLGKGKLKHQTVTVFVNDTQIATWQIASEGWYEARIPAENNHDGKLNIKLTISDPISPKEVGQSQDSRKLGIAVKEMVISEVK